MAVFLKKIQLYKLYQSHLKYKNLNRIKVWRLKKKYQTNSKIMQRSQQLILDKMEHKTKSIISYREGCCVTIKVFNLLYERNNF